MVFAVLAGTAVQKTSKLQYLCKLCFENPGFEQIAYVRGRRMHSHCSLSALWSARGAPTAVPMPSGPPGALPLQPQRTGRQQARDHTIWGGAGSYELQSYIYIYIY